MKCKIQDRPFSFLLDPLLHLGNLLIISEDTSKWHLLLEFHSPSGTFLKGSLIPIVSESAVIV